MSEAITWLKLYMDNRRIGKNVSQEYIDMVNLLIESCIRLKQQLKDKDEKISKVIEYCLNEREDVNGSKCDDILEILESNIQDLKKLKGE
jgi:hypothetical protein